MLTPDVEPYRLSVDDVLRMSEVGIIGEDERVELLDGVLVAMSPPSPGHSEVVARLTAHFVRAASDLQVRVQDALLVEGGFLMPDVLVVDPPPRGEYLSTARLVVEVSVTTQHHDRRKATRYARAGVAEYWLLDVPARTLHLHRDPHGDRYATTSRHGAHERVRPCVGGPPVDLAGLLDPPAS